MSARTKFERALAGVIAKQTGEAWPVTAYVLYAMTSDPETMEMEEPFRFVSEGQRDYITRGLVEQLRDELSADVVNSLAYVDMDFEDDEDA